MRKRGIWVCLLLFLFILSGCGLKPWKTTEDDPRTKDEDKYDPLGFPQDRVIVTEMGNPKEGERNTDFEKETGIGLNRSETEESFFSFTVYRVQFFATKYPNQAARVAESVGEQLSQKTYIEYKAPYYWVRVGDCETKKEAEYLQKKINELGYEESWVVEVKIKP
jgi:hypothetical protein